MESNNDFNYPRILHLYWNGPLPFLNYLTVLSFRKWHKNWEINIYITTKINNTTKWKTGEQMHKINCHDYMNELKNDSTVNIVDISAICEKLKIDNLNYTYQSDILRMYLLKEYGGVWSDFDIIYIKNIEDAFCKYKTDICFKVGNNNCYYPIGFFLSMGNKSIVFNKIYDDQIKILQSGRVNYQKFGVIILNKIFNTNNDLNKTRHFENIYKVKFLGQEYYLPYEWNQLNLLYNCVDMSHITENTVGIHWFNGGTKSRKYVNMIEKIDSNNFNAKCTMDKLILPYLKYKNAMNKKNKKVSIVMAYYNRREQLLFTLKTIENSKYKNIEIIIVDDGSNNEYKLDDVVNKYHFDIKLIRIEPENKKWVNPCIPYNIGIKNATGDIIVLQNPEVCHVGDCIKFIVDNIDDGQYISFNCYGLPNPSHNEMIKKIYNGADDITDIYNNINNRANKAGGNAFFNKNVGGWLNHHKYHFVAYHYLAAMTRNTMNYIGGGFCELYKNGVCYDDNDFIKQLIYKKIKFLTTIFSNDKPFCIHQYHKSIKHNKNTWLHNQKIFFKRMNEIGLSHEVNIHKENFMPKPKYV